MTVPIMVWFTISVLLVCAALAVCSWSYKRGMRKGYTKGVQWGRSKERALTSDTWIHPDDFDPEEGP